MSIAVTKKIGAKNFARVAELGGFGRVGVDEGGLSPDSTLDLTGVLDPENKAVSDEAKAEIQSIIDASDEDVETPASLAKAHNKEELSAMAVELGLDGNSYTSKNELAQAIISKRNESAA